ncbi:C-type lectin LmsL-like [Anolis carolinensis]|uniref:C-type lectin LmsL-like n=1 Tax=Anolis carolinensis TaxID=28377 RepID=UPI002F2B7D48
MVSFLQRGNKLSSEKLSRDRREDKQVQMGLDSSSYLSLWGLWVVCLFQPAMSSCPRGWMAYESGCFGYFNVDLNWGDAEVACQKFGASGHLASFHDRKELEAMAKYIRQVNNVGKPLWIGLYDTKRSSSIQNREFKWTDGSPVPYMPWDAGEPNAWVGKEFCGELTKDGFNLLNDKECAIRQPYICRFEPGVSG